MMAKVDQVGPRTRRARTMMVVLFALSIVLGAGLLFGNLGEPQDVLGGGPFSKGVAVLLIAVWAAYFLVSWLWWRNVDEHERQAYDFGCVVAVHFYTFVVPIWWVGWRSGLLPEPRHMLMLLVTMVVWSIAWFWRRYR